MLSDLELCRVEKLTENVNISILYWGWALISADGIRSHEQHSLRPQHFWFQWSHVWALLKIERDDPCGEPMSLYAAHNIVREGWCVLTQDLHKLVNLLRI